MRQQIYLDGRYGYELPDGNRLYFLRDPLILPDSAYHWSVSVPHASIPLTHYTITPANDTLALDYSDGSTSSVKLPHGNFSVDEIAAYTSIRLSHGYAMTYSENTNKIRLSTLTPGIEAEIGAATTCQTLLGVRAGDTTILGGYTAPDGVNLAGTSCFFIRGNLSTRNREPVSLGFSRILAKIPITQAANGIEKYLEAGPRFPLWDTIVSFLSVEILDDDMQPVEFHGGHWSVTLEFDLEPAVSFAARRDYREVWQREINGPLAVPPDPTQRERPDEGPGGRLDVSDAARQPRGGTG